jgi:hypothetical protein
MDLPGVSSLLLQLKYRQFYKKNALNDTHNICLSR